MIQCYGVRPVSQSQGFIPVWPLAAGASTRTQPASLLGMLTVNRLTGLAVLKARPVFKLPVWLTVP